MLFRSRRHHNCVRPSWLSSPIGRGRGLKIPRVWVRAPRELLIDNCKGLTMPQHSEIYARKLGITIDNWIGSGCFANVYSIKESKSWVLKCTSDYDELEIINRLNRCSIPIPGFVTIINPSIINGSPGWGRESRLCYLAEACTGLSERQRHIWSAVWRVT